MYPRSSGDRLVWQDRFTNVGMVLTNGGILVGAASINKGLTGGQVRYYGAAHDLRWAGAFTVVGHAIVSATGSDQALFSLGTAASRRCEVGITGTGQPYAWGTAQVTVGEVIPDGHHDIGFVVSTSGAVTCVVDGELWGSGSITFGTTFDRLVVAGSCLGGLAWLGQISDLKAFCREMPHEEVAAEQGVSDYFTPALLNPVAWFRPGNAWWGYNTQPTWAFQVSNFIVHGSGSFVDVPGGGYSGGNAIRYTNTTGTINHGIRNGTACITGNRYDMRIRCMPDGSGNTGFARLGLSGGQASATTAVWQLLSEQTTPSSDILYLLDSVGVLNGVLLWSDFRATNLSLTDWRNFYGTAGGVMAQANPTYMPWFAQEAFGGRGGVRAAVGDQIASNLLASTWTQAHNGNGFSFAFPVVVETLAHEHVPLATTSRNANNRGMAVNVANGTGRPGLYIMNASGVYAATAISPAAALSVNTPAILSGTVVSGVGGVKLRLNGVEVSSADLLNPSDFAPNSGLMFLAHGAGSTIGLEGSMRDGVLVNRVWSLAEQDQTERYLAAGAGVVL